MREGTSEYRGRPLLFLFGFVGTWIVARSVLVSLEGPPISTAPLPAMTLYSGQGPEKNRIETPRVSPPIMAAILLARSNAEQSAAYTEPAAFKQISEPSIVNRIWLSAVARPSVDASNVSFVVAPLSAPVGPAKIMSSGTERQPKSLQQGSIDTPTETPQSLSGSAWLFWRDGSGERALNGALSPRYGASQAGMRIAYRPDDAGRVEIYGRATAALQSDGKDVAAGTAVKPFSHLNVALAAEYRQALDKSARSGPALMTYGGFGPHPLGAGWTAEGYAQAGVVGVKKPLAFADGAVRIKRSIATVGPVPVSAGVGAWAGAQEDSERVDIGPMVDFDLARVTKAPMRASIDWRQRVAGKATPDSGIAVTLATDF